MKTKVFWCSTCLLVAALSAGACSRKPPTRPPVAADPSAPAVWQTAEQHFSRQEYALAAADYEEFLNNRPESDRAETALFRLALIHALPESPLYDPEKAGQLFLQVSETYPDGPHSEEVLLIRYLLQWIHEARESVPAPPTPPIEWQLAEDRFADAQYAAAAEAYQRFLSGEPESSVRAEKALFRLALLHALPESPVANPEMAHELFLRVLESHPNGHYAEEARLILLLQEQIEDVRQVAEEKEERIRALSSELEKIKAIDLKKRVPQQ